MNDSMNIEDLYKKLTKYVTQDRLKHSVGVMKTAASLAELYKADKKKAEIAGLLHDVARDLKLEDMLSLCSDRIDKTNKYVKNNKLLLHACAGRIIAERDFGINDADILSAIEKHTTGSKDMNLLDKIIFVADYVEPTRSFRGVKKARKLAYRDLNRAMLYIYRSILIYLLRKNRYICIETLEGYNSVLMGLNNASV